MKCRFVFRMSNGDTERSPIFDGPGYATDWLESGMKLECPEKSGERFLIIQDRFDENRGYYKIINPRYIVSITLEEVKATVISPEYVYKGAIE